MTRLFCSINQYQRGLMLNNKIYCLLFISNLILDGFWAFGQPVSFIWMTLSQSKKQKGLWKCAQSLTEPGTWSCPSCFSSAVSSLALAAHSWDHRNGKVIQHVHTSSNRQPLEINTKASVFINAEGRSKTACKFSAVSSCFLIWLAALSPSNLLLSLCLHLGMKSLVRSLKVIHL